MRTSLAVAAAVVVSLAGAGPAAAGTLDQQQTTTNQYGIIGGPDSWRISSAQTFTAGETGDLDRVDLYLRESDAPNNSAGLTVEIRKVSAGAPGSDVLASDTLTPAEIPDWFDSAAFVSATFDPPAPVTAGTQYAIVAYTGAADGYVWGMAGEFYAGGQQFYSLTSPPGTWTAEPGFDMAFKTYVEQPAPQFAFTGFASPVDNAPIVNSMKAGAAVPVKFSLGGDQGLDILAAGSPSSQRIACTGGAPTDAIEETVTASNSGLQYDPITDLYTYVWKTNKSWAGTCHQLTVKLSDGTSHVAHFQFRS